jgi:hypothetical protein
MDKDHDDGQYDKATQERFQAEQIHKEAGLKNAEVVSFPLKEEYAAEIAPHPSNLEKSYRQTEVMDSEKPAQAISRSRGIGYTAILLALVSLFAWPAFLGPIASVLGYFAYKGGSKALGAWSIILGLISLTAYVLWLPYIV